MASRLSDLSTNSVYDSGLASLAWDDVEPGANLLHLDLDKIATRSDAKGLIQSLPPQIIYHAIKLRGMEQSSTILPLLSNEQLTRILDYDVWPADSLSLLEASRWLSEFKKVGIEGISSRFRQLDEEYQIALLEKYLKAYDLEQFEKLDPQHQDGLIAFPGNELFYEILSDDKEIREFITNLFASAISTDMNYAVNLLLHATHMPPNESEFHLQQFRKARLEEDGFVSYQESLEAFHPLDIEPFKAKWSEATRDQDSFLPKLAEFQNSLESLSFLEAVVVSASSIGKWNDEDGLRFQQASLYLANSLSSACRVEIDDLQALNRILEQQKALISLGLDYVSAGRPELACQILKFEHPKTLFRLGLSLIYRFQQSTLTKLGAWDLPLDILSNCVKRQKWGAAQDVIDKSLLPEVGLQLAEALKGIFNRFPMRIVLDPNDKKHIKFSLIDSMSAYHQCTTEIKKLIESELKVLH